MIFESSLICEQTIKRNGAHDTRKEEEEKEEKTIQSTLFMKIRIA